MQREAELRHHVARRDVRFGRDRDDPREAELSERPGHARAPASVAIPRPHQAGSSAHPTSGSSATCGGTAGPTRPISSPVSRHTTARRPKPCSAQWRCQRSNPSSLCARVCTPARWRVNAGVGVPARDGVAVVVTEPPQHQPLGLDHSVRTVVVSIDGGNEADLRLTARIATLCSAFTVRTTSTSGTLVAQPSQRLDLDGVGEPETARLGDRRGVVGRADRATAEARARRSVNEPTTPFASTATVTRDSRPRATAVSSIRRTHGDVDRRRAPCRRASARRRSRRARARTTRRAPPGRRRSTSEGASRPAADGSGSSASRSAKLGADVALVVDRAGAPRERGARLVEWCAKND